MGTKLSAFMTAYKFRKTDEDKLEYLLQHIKHEYIPYEHKADMAKAIVESSFYIVEKTPDGKERRVFHINSIAKYMLTCMTIVKLFTTIECSSNEGKMLDDFNTLNQSGIIDMIIQNIDQRELKEFNMILQMTCDDVMTNEYELHAFINNQIARFEQLINVAIAPIMNELDIEKIKDMINQGIETT